jgi:hypothetical protein
MMVLVIFIIALAIDEKLSQITSHVVSLPEIRAEFPLERDIFHDFGSKIQSDALIGHEKWHYMEWCVAIWDEIGH